ncbi:MAG: NeuD/PglB/VioB family sugar acetyltransferase [Hyphomicrobiales bacterium]|nr:NeuD/PglB/VioB family sugar acetyltransferase [Hyphomicrobiales bacterium]
MSADGRNDDRGRSRDAKTGEAKTPEAKTPDAKTPDAKTPDAKTLDAKTPDAKSWGGLLLLGLGGHARSVADVALDLGAPALAFVNPSARPGERCLGWPCERELPGALAPDWAAFPASGDNRRRCEQVESVLSRGWPLASIVSRRASVGCGAQVDRGVFIGHHAHIGPLASIGRGALINTAAVVEHDCIVGAFSHVSVNATVAGKSRIGAFVFVGAGATIIDGLTVADHVIIGAGATVVDDIDRPGTYVGSPARLRSP